MNLRPSDKELKYFWFIKLSKYIFNNINLFKEYSESINMVKRNKDFLKQIKIHFEPRKKYLNDIEYASSEEIKEIYEIYRGLKKIPNADIKKANLQGKFIEDVGYTYEEFVGVDIVLQGPDETIKESFNFLNRQGRRHCEVQAEKFEKDFFNRKYKATEQLLREITKSLENRL